VDTQKEGNLEAPTRHPLNWKEPEFWDEAVLFAEMERAFDICHGCRRCVSLCNSFPTLFDLVDESKTMEVDGVAKSDYYKVVDHCYLCDLCYLTKCPYVPPHEWNLDFPHLMLRAKAAHFKQEGASVRDKLLTSTDTVGRLAGIPIIVQTVNVLNKTKPARKLLDSVLGVHKNAVVPKYHSQTMRKRLGSHESFNKPIPAGRTKGKVALFATCYGNYNEPELGEDLLAIFEHNGIAIKLVDYEQCCGMPKLELGDLDSVEKAKNKNIPELAQLIDEGWDIVGPIPSCVLMFKQELPLMFPNEPDVMKVRDHIYDPFEYLMLRSKHNELKTDFKQGLGKVVYHVACHQRVQKIGMKTRECLQLIPDTEIITVERCSGHDGTYAVKSEYHDVSMKICRPVFNKVKKEEPDVYTSDCPMAGHQIKNGLDDGSEPQHPLRLLRRAYGI